MGADGFYHEPAEKSEKPQTNVDSLVFFFFFGFSVLDRLLLALVMVMKSVFFLFLSTFLNILNNMSAVIIVLFPRCLRFMNGILGHNW